MQSSAVMLPLSGVLQNFPDHVLKNYCFLLAGTHAFLRASCGVSELGVIAPRGCPSLPYCINRKDPCMSAFFLPQGHLLRAVIFNLFSKLHTMHNQLLSFLSFHNHINTFSCSSFIRSKGK